MTTMQLVERHIISKNDPRWAVIDHTCWLSKNLYNAANYIVRQEYIFNHHFIPYAQLDKLMKHNPDYCALPRKVSQWVLKQVNQDWQNYFTGRAEYQSNPKKFTGCPRLPTYKDTAKGRNLLVYTDQAVSRKLLTQKGVIQPSQLAIQVQTKQKNIDQVRIVPRKTYYVIEVIYTVEIDPLPVEPHRIASLDIGLNTLAAVTFNQPEFTPLLVNGRPLKSINHHYNKERARLQSELPCGQFTSKRLEQLTEQRNRRVAHYLHLVSRRLIDVLCLNRIGTLVIGKNLGWKQAINLGKRTNQNFVYIPHARFIDMLCYKAQLVGIQVILIEESYTSKCSFLDDEPICKHEVYQGRRVKRGLFVASDGRKINADVNGSYNIMRKAIPNPFGDGIRASVVKPVRVTPA